MIGQGFLGRRRSSKVAPPSPAPSRRPGCWLQPCRLPIPKETRLAPLQVPIRAVGQVRSFVSTEYIKLSVVFSSGSESQAQIVARSVAGLRPHRSSLACPPAPRPPQAIPTGLDDGERMSKWHEPGRGAGWVPTTPTTPFEGFTLASREDQKPGRTISDRQGSGLGTG